MLHYPAMNTDRIQGRLGIEDRFQRTAGEFALDRLKSISIEEVAAEKTATGENLSLYVHIPFCTEICSFCAFHRQVGNNLQQEEYTQALETHIDEVLPQFGRTQQISSIYVGGGTPGLLTSEQAARIISRIQGVVDTSDAQISYELHPENISEEHIHGLVTAGVGRFSVGVQTLSDDERATLGRSLTSAQQDLTQLQILNQLGVSYNLDLMYGTPLQTLESWIDTVRKIVHEVYPPEITIYQYVNAHGSMTKRWIAEGKITRPDFGIRSTMYNLALREMSIAGYRQTSTYSFSRNDDSPDRALLSHGSDFLGLGPRTYSRVGRYLFINDARTSDFRSEGHMSDYVGVKLPLPIMSILDRTFALAASGSPDTALPLPAVLKNLNPELVAQAYGVLYYITNQPRLSRRKSLDRKYEQT